tara:strand:- start:69 stop:359 length:291 start_codon:yes stop_codon:yes gene_type:complete
VELHTLHLAVAVAEEALTALLVLVDLVEAELLLAQLHHQTHQVKAIQVEIEQVETLAHQVVQALVVEEELVAMVYQAVTDLNQVEVVTVETVHHLT